MNKFTWTIRNNALDINRYNFAACYDVPKSDSIFSQEQRHMSYKLRCYYEQLGCETAGGCSVFETLTYAPEYLPKYCGVPCFNHKDIIDFRKRFRQYFEDRGYATYTEDTNGKHSLLKMFIVSEYGGDTCRPHYHVIVWCYIPHIGHKTLARIIHKTWKYGFTDKKVKPICIRERGVGAIHYVTKYMEKCNDEILELKSRQQKACDLTPEKRAEIIESAPQHFKLRCWSSNELGIYALKWLQEHPNYLRIFQDKGLVPMPNAANKIDLLAAPHYLVYKYFYDRVWNRKTGNRDRYVLNARGEHEKVASLDRKIDRLNSSYIEAWQYLTPEETAYLVSNGYGSTNLRPLAEFAITMNNHVTDDVDMPSKLLFEDSILTKNKRFPNPLKREIITKEEMDGFKQYICNHHIRNAYPIETTAIVYLTAASERKMEVTAEEKKRKQKIYDHHRAYQVRKRAKVWLNL